MAVSIMIGDCRNILAKLPSQSFHTCITSPPYFGLRDYGVDGQIGLEQTPDAFVADLVDVFREVRRVLRDDGTLWLNLGDSYARTGGTDKHASKTSRVGSSQNTLAQMPCRDQKVPSGFKEKDLLGIPWRVAFALQADGWYLRQDIIWHKPNAMPESVRDRCTKAHEYIFLLSKSDRYFFDSDAVKEPAADATRSRLAQDVEHHQGSDRVPGKTNGRMKAIGNSETRNRRSVWTVATKPFKGAHFATFPVDLITPCILAGSPKNGMVLDPFGGSGTTGLAAAGLGRNATMIEINLNYAEIAKQRIGLEASIVF